MASETENVVTEQPHHVQTQSTGNGTDDDRTQHMRHLEKEMFQLVNYYFVFQGVILAAFYTIPTHLKCKYRWIPMALSALAGTLNILAIIRLAFTYKHVLDEAARDRANRGEVHIVDAAAMKVWRSVYVVGSVIAILAFLVITLVACSLVNCDKSAVPT